ncbi:MAG: alpha/beta hydrolase [Porphyrobacter sp.]|nr:alpha/beta hydrolase [Porphyrobacter sp.]
MNKTTLLAVAAVATLALPAHSAPPGELPPAIYTDPAPDPASPARMEVLHIPSGGVEINGVAYLASGKGPHPTVIICHGWPGNEKNLDLAQTIRRAGWNTITFNYRGAWGSPGVFRFAQNPQDAKAVLAFLRNPPNAAKLGVDPGRIAMIGHSMGGWVTTFVASEDESLIGAGLISAANMGVMRGLDREGIVKLAGENSEALAGTTPEGMADELIAGQPDFDFIRTAQRLAGKPLLVLSSDDGLAPQTDALVAAVRKAGGNRITTYHATTDHSWSNSRIDLAERVIKWLESL